MQLSLLRGLLELDASMRNCSEQNQLFVEEQIFNLHFLETERHLKTQISVTYYLYIFIASEILKKQSVFL